MPYRVVRELEERIASWAGARFGVAVESCSAAIYLSCLYRKVGYVTIPRFTYPSVPCAILTAGGSVGFRDESWSGAYSLDPVGIVDSALRFRRGMYQRGALYCLSFHIKKHLPIGRGGMILTDDEDAYRWLKKARFDGRDEVPLAYDDLTMTGWNGYLQPEQAARGLQLFELIKDTDPLDLDREAQGYPDLSKCPVYGAPYLTLRKATMEDAALLLKWKNEPDTRSNSIVSQEEIQWESHLNWLEKTLKNGAVELSIIELDGRSIGDLRLDWDGETEVSIRMDVAFRGKGVATKAVGMVNRKGPLKAKIVAHNLASMRVFLKNSYLPYELIRKSPVDYYIFRKTSS
jgi:RimJ/RimL family protein N-acetyltransferase